MHRKLWDAPGSRHGDGLKFPSLRIVGNKTTKKMEQSRIFLTFICKFLDVKVKVDISEKFHFPTFVVLCL